MATKSQSQKPTKTSASSVSKIGKQEQTKELVLKGAPKPSTSLVKATTKVMPTATVVKEVKSVGKKYGKHVSRYLRRFSPWLRSISDPFNVRGVQIPDIVTAPSGTFTIWLRRSVTVNANGVVALTLGLAPGPYPAAVNGSMIPIEVLSDEVDSFAVGAVSPSNATESALFGPSPGSPLPERLYLSQWSTVRMLYNQVRLVSAGLRCTFTGNFTTAEGTITLVSATRDWLRDTSELESGSCSVALLQTHPDAQIISIPKYYGGIAIYKPLDNVSLEYSDVQHRVETGAIPDSFKGGEIFMAVTGAVANQTFQVDCVFNFEGIPRTNQLDLVNANVSKYDVVSTETTWNSMPELPPAMPLPVKGIGPEAKAPEIMPKPDEKLQTPQHPATEKTMIETIVDAMPEVLDKGMKFAEKVSPFLAALL